MISHSKTFTKTKLEAKRFLVDSFAFECIYPIVMEAWL